MAAECEPGLEQVPQDFPEVSHGQQGYAYQQQGHAYQQQGYAYQQQAYHPDLDRPYYQPPYEPSASTNKEPAGAAPRPGSQPADGQPGSKPPAPRTICGCNLVVLVLSCTIALLSAAVIGLATATGIESQRASHAASSLAAMSASVSSALGAASTTPATPATTAAVLDDGCSEDFAGVNGTVYTSHPPLGSRRFTRHCNKDAPNMPLLALFAANFATCMDACAAYTKYMPANFAAAAAAAAASNSSSSSDSSDGSNSSGSDDANVTTCKAVSFVPAWTSKAAARARGASGNCYLKGGPQSAGALLSPEKGVDCHAAIAVAG